MEVFKQQTSWTLGFEVYRFAICQVEDPWPFVTSDSRPGGHLGSHDP